MENIEIEECSCDSTKSTDSIINTILFDLDNTLLPTREIDKEASFQVSNYFF